MISRLTLGQVSLFWNEPRDQGQTVMLPRGHSNAVVAARAEERRQWVEDQLRRIDA